MIEAFQKNAEWMCAIAIVVFSGVQVWLYYAQIRQDLKFKRLDLANKLEEVCKDFPVTKEEVRALMSFLNANRSLFISLLNRKDILNYGNLYRLTFVLNQGKQYPAHEVEECVKIFFEYVDTLSSVLCNANYGFSKYNKENPFGDEKKKNET